MGKVVEYMPSCHSTNDTAREMLVSTDIKEGTFVITDHQTAGKGQRGNSWFSAEGKNLTFSIILKPGFLSVDKQFYLNMIGSLAVKAMLNELVNDGHVEVKWPNDIILNGRKACGILIENSVRKSNIEYSIVGIGLNVNQKSIGLERATSLVNEANREYPLQQVLDSLLGHLESLYLKLKSGKEQEIKERYLESLLGYKRLRKYRAEYIFDGEIIDVRDSGHLEIRTPGGSELFDFKEVEFIWN